MITIRQEAHGDHKEVFEVIKAAFSQVDYSDQSEPYLVERLRKSEHFIPELSLVALLDHQIVGHILVTKIYIISKEKQFTSLALAPVSVLPAFQSKGFGSQLIQRAHEIAHTLGYDSIVLIGHKDYYPRFGYEPAQKYGIEFPFEAPSDYCMVIGLTPGSLTNIKGMVQYPPAFYA